MSFDPTPLGCAAQTPDVVWTKEEITVTHKHLTTNEGGPIYQKGETNYPAASFGVWTGGAIMRKVLLPAFLLFLFIAAFPFKGYSAEPTYPIFTDVKTTRERTVSPIPVPNPGPNPLSIGQVELYEPTGYSSWKWDNGVDYGPLLLNGSRAEKPTRPKRF